MRRLEKRSATVSQKRWISPSSPWRSGRLFSEKIDTDIFDCITVEASVNARNVTGGTARAAVEHEIQRAREGK